jgi:cell division protein FtsI (penicillin-binding protein 3)
MTSVRRSQTAPTGPRIRTRRTRLPAPGPRRRIAGLLAIYLLGMALLGGRLVQIQVVDSEQYADLSVAQRVRTIELPATRGRIYDRGGDVLATSVDAATIYGDPRAYRPRTLPNGTVVEPAVTPAEAAAALAELLDVDPVLVEARLASDAHFVYIARQLDWELGQQVMALELPGIGRLTEPRRQYPGGSLAAQVVGFTGIDGDGLEGLELAYESLLRGTPGHLTTEQAPAGLTIASGLRQLTPAEPGTDLVLTIDRQVQAIAEQAALAAVEAHDAAGASVVVIEVATGDVLAMASVPGFNPTDRNGTDLTSRRNRVVTDVFEPGSVQKAVTIAAAIDQGLIHPDTVLEVPDRIRIHNKTFSEIRRRDTEEMTVTEIMQQSSNVGTMMIAQMLGEQRLYDHLVDFGFTRPTGVGFPGEVSGLLPHVDNWWGTSLPTIAIGQGVAATLLHHAAVYATIANDGVTVNPRIVRGTVGSDGRLRAAPIDSGERILSATTAAQMRTMLQTVIEGSRGTGRNAAVAGYDIAGKTGTAQKPRVDGRGYGDGYVATFVGMAPVERPELVVAVMVDEPRNGHYGGVAAAPVFSTVMEFALRARHVPPTRAAGSLEQAFTDAVRARHDAEAARAAAQENPAVADGEVTSPPVGTPVGGDGTGVGADLAEEPDE